jgi:hypothetical protein
MVFDWEITVWDADEDLWCNTAEFAHKEDLIILIADMLKHCIRCRYVEARVAERRFLLVPPPSERILLFTTAARWASQGECIWQREARRHSEIE